MWGWSACVRWAGLETMCPICKQLATLVLAVHTSCILPTSRALPALLPMAGGLAGRLCVGRLGWLALPVLCTRLPPRCGTALAEELVWRANNSCFVCRCESLLSTRLLLSQTLVAARHSIPAQPSCTTTACAPCRILQLGAGTHHAHPDATGQSDKLCSSSPLAGHTLSRLCLFGRRCLAATCALHYPH